VFLNFPCKEGDGSEHISNQDSILISKMIWVRKKGMIDRNLDVVISQFDQEATWINSQGYYFEGRPEILKFPTMLNGNDSFDNYYYYEARIPLVKVINETTDLA
jgi:hypothetical protein